MPYAHRIPATIRYLCAKLDIEDDESILRFLPACSKLENSGKQELAAETQPPVVKSRKKRGRIQLNEVAEPVNPAQTTDSGGGQQKLAFSPSNRQSLLEIDQSIRGNAHKAFKIVPSIETSGPAQQTIT